MIDVVLVKLTEVVSHMRIQFEVRGTILQNRRPTNTYGMLIGLFKTLAKPWHW
jgi:hypothetical protein